MILICNLRKDFNVKLQMYKQQSKDRKTESHQTEKLLHNKGINEV